MSHQTKQQLLARLRRQYAQAGLLFKTQLLDQAGRAPGLSPQGGHSRAARQAQAVRTVAVVLGRPRQYDPQILLPVLKPIWFAAWPGSPTGSARARDDSAPPTFRFCTGEASG